MSEVAFGFGYSGIYSVTGTIHSTPWKYPLSLYFYISEYFELGRDILTMEAAARVVHAFLRLLPIRESYIGPRIIT